MKKHSNQMSPHSLQNLDSAFDDELIVEERLKMYYLKLDEDDDQQRQNRIEMLQNQDRFWKSCLGKQSNTPDKDKKNAIQLYQNQHQMSVNPENYDNYFKKYNGMSAKLILLKDLEDTDDDKDDHKENKDDFDDELDEVSLIRNISIQSLEHRTVPKIMSIKLATMKKQSYKNPQDQYDDEFETPTPCEDDENKNISHHMKSHSYSLPKKMTNSSPNYQAEVSKKFNSDKNGLTNQSGQNHERYSSVPRKHHQQPLVSPFTPTPHTPEDNFNTPNDDFNIGDENQSNDNFMKAYLDQQKYLQQQAEQNHNDQSLNVKSQKVIQPQLSFEQNREHSIREMMKSNSTEGYDEITPQQRSYFASIQFRDLLLKGIIPDLQSKKDFYDNENYIVILRDVKWNRIYLKKLNMYVQIRVFQSKDQYSVYLDSYKKIVSKFIKFMPQTVYSDDRSFIIIQKLGDFSLYDLSNLILIEAKQHESINYQKYYLQMLSNLFDSLILILFHNYYIGNINSRNVFVSKVQNEFVIKFSNLVDFSFDYSQICDKNYACVLQPKPKCMQEMMDRDKYYLQKKNVKEFITRHKTKYSKMMNILSFFLLRNDSMRNGVNFDVIQQFILNSFEDSERVIQLSDRSIKHIQYMIQTSKLHLSLVALDLNNKLIEQKLFFFMQQMHFHQDFEDDEIQYIIKFINRMLYRHLFDKIEESQLFSMMLDTLISDASVFRRNKNLQKATYIIYVLYLLKNSQKIDKSIPYWRYMSQTTSLVDYQNPVSLYYVGVYNLNLLDNQKALKYFQYAYQCKNYCDDIMPHLAEKRKRQEEDDDSEEDEKSNGKPLKANGNNKSPIISCKPKRTNAKHKRHSIFDSNNQEDNYILKIREAYGYLGILKYTFTQEGNAKKIQQIIYEAKSMGVYGVLDKLIQLELQICGNMKNYLQNSKAAKLQNIFFVEQICSSSAFNVNNFQQNAKTIQNSATLTENFKSQFQQYQSNESLVYKVWGLFSQQIGIQQQIAEKVAEIKKIQNFASDKQRVKTFGSFNNLDYRSYPIDNY